MKRIALKEFEPRSVRLSPADASRLSSAFHRQVEVRITPVPGEYVLIPKGYAGTIQLTDCVLAVRPKVPVSNLFWMLSYAHDLADFRGLDAGLTESDDIFEFIVRIFAKKVFDLVRQGLNRGYVEREENLRTIRGRIAVMQHIRRNCAVKSRVYCRYVEHTEDILENRILKLCCYLLLRHPIQDQDTVMALHVTLGRFENVALVAPTDAEMDAVQFSRLNERYTGCIALARLLLRHMSVDERTGDVPVSSFLIDMQRLFERFVAAVLRPHVEALGGTMCTQYPVRVTQRERGLSTITGRADIVVQWADGGLVVLDTKYKEPGYQGHVAEDIYQVATYCTALGSKLGMLLYASAEEWEWRRQVANSRNRIAGMSVPLGGARESISRRIAQVATLAADTEAECLL